MEIEEKMQRIIDDAALAYFDGLIDARTRAKELAPYIKEALKEALWEYDNDVVKPLKDVIKQLKENGWHR
jgi:hypothetical protein